MAMGPDGMFNAMVANMLAKTGRPLDEWIGILSARGLATRKERIAWLQKEHGLTHGYAMVIAEKTAEAPGFVPPTAKQLLAHQYAGAKAALRPIYDRLAEGALALGEVTLDPRKTYVAINRGRQFGVIQASSRTRVDLGLRLRGVAPSARLQGAAGFGSGNITHRVSLAAAEDVDDEIRGWLRQAYEAAK